MSQVLYTTKPILYSTSTNSPATSTASSLKDTAKRSFQSNSVLEIGRTLAPTEIQSSALRGIVPPSLSAAQLLSYTSSSSRPRRAAAIVSQANTAAVANSNRRKTSQSNTSKSTSNPSSKITSKTPQQQSGAVEKSYQGLSTQDQQSNRVMAALPRSKRPRRGAAPVDEPMIASHHHHHQNNNGNYINGRLPDSNGISKQHILMGIDSSLSRNYPHHQTNGIINDPHHVSIPISTSSSSTSRLGGGAANGSIRELINGQETEVFVIDSTSPPPSKTYNDTDPSLVARGKRKAIASPIGVGAGSSVNGATSLTAAKRRRKDGNGLDQAALQPWNNKLATSDAPYSHPQDYVNSQASAAAQVGTGTKANVSSYRGGYNANYSYQSPNNGVPYFTERPGQPIDDSEGHYIIREGNLVAGRYAIRSLLGQGTFGKVVRCKDTMKNREVAIKIIRSIQKYTDAAQIEIRVLQALRDNDPRNENKCIHLIDTFSHHNHVCIVSELLGKSVFDFLKENSFHPFPCRDIWSFAKQLLRSVAFLHDLGLVHTDLKPENILLVHNDYDVVPLSKRANSRKKRVLRDSEIRLIDFGSATFNDEYHSQVVSTRHYRAPEIILQMGWSFPCDAWSIGCILIEFYTGEALFQTHDNLEHLAMMETVLGIMPDDFRRKAETYRPGYFYGGRLDFPNAQTNKQSRKFVKAMKTIEGTINSGSNYSKHDQRFIHLLKRLLTFDPLQRIRVDQALKHPYFDLTPNEIPPTIKSTSY